MNARARAEEMVIDPAGERAGVLVELRSSCDFFFDGGGGEICVRMKLMLVMLVKNFMKKIMYL